MKINPNIENYLQNLQLDQLFQKLGASNPKTLAKEIEHFTTKEAKKRDKIVIGYFGKKGINQITDKIIKLLLSPPKIPSNAHIRLSSFT
ncbi:MAG: hypothetical protein K6T73_08905 [Candidatus Bathyarchaeota archaeon]|nr:hypothetical protein [Candidatus Bathyarchaeota archaeon]